MALNYIGRLLSFWKSVKRPCVFLVWVFLNILIIYDRNFLYILFLLVVNLSFLFSYIGFILLLVLFLLNKIKVYTIDISVLSLAYICLLIYKFSIDHDNVVNFFDYRKLVINNFSNISKEFNFIKDLESEIILKEYFIKDIKVYDKLYRIVSNKKYNNYNLYIIDITSNINTNYLLEFCLNKINEYIVIKKDNKIYYNNNIFCKNIKSYNFEGYTIDIGSNKDFFNLLLEILNIIPVKIIILEDNKILYNNTNINIKDLTMEEGEYYSFLNIEKEEKLIYKTIFKNYNIYLLFNIDYCSNLKRQVEHNQKLSVMEKLKVPLFHDLANILTNLSLSLEKVNKDLNITDPFFSIMSNITGFNNKALLLVKKFLNIHKPNKQKLQMDVNEYIDDFLNKSQSHTISEFSHYFLVNAIDLQIHS